MIEEDDTLDPELNALTLNTDINDAHEKSRALGIVSGLGKTLSRPTVAVKNKPSPNTITIRDTPTLFMSGIFNQPKTTSLKRARSVCDDESPYPIQSLKKQE